MKILAVGSDKTIKEEFIFKCKCGAIWTAKRKEVNFTPPCLPYDVYMKCPYCKEIRYISENKVVREAIKNVTIDKKEVLRIIESYKVGSNQKLSKEDFNRNFTLQLIQEEISGAICEQEGKNDAQ